MSGFLVRLNVMELIIGLPVRLLVSLAHAVKNSLKRPLDVVLTYSHMTLQNTTLENWLSEFHAAGVQQIITASPLAMGLLRSAGPQLWHPATQSQRDAVIRAAEYVEKRGHNMADTSMRFVYSRWHGCIVGGWSSVKELEDAVQMWHQVKNAIGKEEDECLWKGAREALGNQVDTMWPSPQKGWVFNDGTRVE
jgi:D-arabinose 1-dehydrogenase